MYAFRLVLVLLTLFFWPTGAVSAQEKITIAGTGDSQQLLRRLAQAFESNNPGRIVEIPDSIGSSGGIKATARGDADMGRIARPLKEKEMSLGLEYRKFAISPVVFVANLPESCTDDLTSAQIVAIFAGKLTDWTELGCQAGKIYVANREAGDSSRSIIEREIPGFKEVVETVGKTIFSTPETIEIIAQTPGTIGYTSLAAIQDSSLHVFKLNGLPPTEELVLTARYPLTSPFALIWKGRLQGVAADFMNFIFSPSGQEIIRNDRIIPVPEP